MDFMAMKRSQLYGLANNPYSSPQQPGGGPYPPSQPYSSPPPHRYPMTMQGRSQMAMGAMQYAQPQVRLGSVGSRETALVDAFTLPGGSQNTLLIRFHASNLCWTSYSHPTPSYLMMSHLFMSQRTLVASTRVCTHDDVCV